VREQVTAALNRAVLADHLGAVLRGHGIRTVIDVGAHTGQYAALLRGLGYEGAIVSFEPVHETFEQLSAAAAGDERWTAQRLALGDRDGSATINVAHSSDFSSFREVSDFGARVFPEAARADRGEEVELRRLDGLLGTDLRDADAPMLLKLDTQGWDMEVLEGATGMLDRVAAVQTEVAFQAVYDGVPAIGEVVGALAARGFVPSGFFPVTRDDGLRLIEADLVAVRSRG
jgi:FkbM family methyltransferase